MSARTATWLPGQESTVSGAGGVKLRVPEMEPFFPELNVPVTAMLPDCAVLFEADG